MRVAELMKILAGLPGDAVVNIYDGAVEELGSMGDVTGHSYCDLTDIMEYQGFDYPGVLYLDFNINS